MLTLALESTAKAASAALTEDGTLLGEYFQCSGLTHSRTLLPMAEALMKNTEREFKQLDRVAVACGPGSFTGVRIGVSAAKGLCWALDIPAVGVSTLMAMAWNALSAPEDCLICCAMDARRAQIYNALFEIREQRPVRLCPDRAISLEDLSNELKSSKKSIFVVGDGAQTCYNHLLEHDLKAVLAPPRQRLQCAWGVAMAAQDEKPVPGGRLLPVYLRLSQAERERQAAMEQNKTM